MDEIEMAFFHGDFSSLRKMISELLYTEVECTNTQEEFLS